eukprot:Gb_06150 [translate_table: standard]
MEGASYVQTKKGSYDLKQALRTWYIIFDRHLGEQGSNGVLQIPIQSSMGRPGMLSFIFTSSHNWLRMEA